MTQRRNIGLENRLQAYSMYLNHVAWCVAELAPELVDALESRGKEWIAVGEEMTDGPESWPSLIMAGMTEAHDIFMDTVRNPGGSDLPF